MATQTIDKTANALSLMAVIRQATTDEEIRKICINVCTTIGENSIVITDDTDPAAVFRNIKLDPIYAAIDECNSIADASNSDSVKQGCQAIVQSLTSILQKLI